MKYNTSSKVELYYQLQDDYFQGSGKQRMLPVITVDNYVELGKLTALRFIEWVCLNPGGVIALPTGKTPEFFIKWVQHFLTNWDAEMETGILAEIGFDRTLKPDFKSLYFFQLDEFFPIDPTHERSFNWFVNEYYIKAFGLDPAKAKLINTFNFSDQQKEILNSQVENVLEVFPNGHIDLSLRVSKLNNEDDILRQKTIQLFDQFCDEYENSIRALGGIGFF